MIESALHIPDWLKPETAENRVPLLRRMVLITQVWIHNGELKIIPLTEFTAHDPPPLALEDALTHMTNAIKSEGTRASLFTDSHMNAAIQAKIKDFPKSLLEQRHIARVMVPRLLAQIIHRNPQVISAGVQSFYTRTTQFKVPLLHSSDLLSFEDGRTLITETPRVQLFRARRLGDCKYPILPSAIRDDKIPKIQSSTIVSSKIPFSSRTRDIQPRHQTHVCIRTSQLILLSLGRKDPRTLAWGEGEKSR